MKVKVIEHKGEKLVKFWCAGCGQFHSVEVKFWNQDKDSPTIDPFLRSLDSLPSTFFKFGECFCVVREGVIHFSPNATHRLKGKTHPMQHEEAWRDGGHNWSEVKPVPEAPSETQPA